MFAYLHESQVSLKELKNFIHHVRELYSSTHTAGHCHKKGCYWRAASIPGKVQCVEVVALTNGRLESQDNRKVTIT